MLSGKDISISPMPKTALSKFSLASMAARLIREGTKWPNQEDDEFQHSGKDPLPPEERLEAAIKKFNAANEIRFVAETNYFAELDNDYKLLQEYGAYKNPVFDGINFEPFSEDTVMGIYKGKPLEIKFHSLDDGSKQQEINFQDGSQIKYTTFAEGGKMKINGEEFEMPAGTILEVKSVNGRVFSQLIQTSDMRRNVISMPDSINRAEEVLKTYNQPQSSDSASV